jgi:hypothetical protein
LAKGWFVFEVPGKRLGGDKVALDAEPGKGLAIAAGSFETERLVGYVGARLVLGRSIGTIGSRFIGTIFETRSSRSLQRPAEDVLGINEVFGDVGAVGVEGLMGGGGRVGAIDAGSSVAPLLGGRTSPLLVAGAVALA